MSDMRPVAIQGAQDVLDSDEEDGTNGGGAAWISGPVGSGKTAAVAAVAQELGLQVPIADAETNACMHAWLGPSDWGIGG